MVPHVVVVLFSLNWVWTHPLICFMVWIHVSKEGGRGREVGRGGGGRVGGKRERGYSHVSYVLLQSFVAMKNEFQLPKDTFR